MKPKFTKQSVILMIILTIVTVGAYIPFWFMKQHKEVNKLNAPKKLKTNLINAYLIIAILSTILTLISLFTNSVVILKFSTLTNRILGAFFIFFSLTMALMFNKSNYFEGINQKPLNLVLAFFFGPFYIQYRINQIDEKELENNDSELSTAEA